MFKRNFKTIKESKEKIRICSYNILAPIVANTSKHRTSCSASCIKWSNRFKMIRVEIKNYNPDIICFQEVQSNIFYQEMHSKMRQYGYFGLFIPQKDYRAKSRTNITSPNLNFGVATFFKPKKFYLLKYEVFDYHKAVSDYLNKNNQSDFIKKSKKRFAGLITYFQDRITNKKFYITNIHLEANPRVDDIKNLQGYILLEHLSKLTPGRPLIICGDFNSNPLSSTYHGFSTGKSKNKFNLEKGIEVEKPIFNTPDEYTKMELKSINKTIFGKEPNYTTYTIDYKNTLDYIFVNDKIEVLGALEELPQSIYKTFKSIPNDKFPSDHLIQGADLKIN